MKHFIYLLGIAMLIFSCDQREFDVTFENEFQVFAKEELTLIKNIRSSFELRIRSDQHSIFKVEHFVKSGDVAINYKGDQVDAIELDREEDYRFIDFEMIGQESGTVIFRITDILTQKEYEHVLEFNVIAPQFFVNTTVTTDTILVNTPWDLSIEVKNNVTEEFTIRFNGDPKKGSITDHIYGFDYKKTDIISTFNYLPTTTGDHEIAVKLTNGLDDVHLLIKLLVVDKLDDVENPIETSDSPVVKRVDVQKFQDGSRYKFLFTVFYDSKSVIKEVIFKDDDGIEYIYPKSSDSRYLLTSDVDYLGNWSCRIRDEKRRTSSWFTL